MIDMICQKLLALGGQYRLVSHSDAGHRGASKPEQQ
jgi:hypothetical protein